VVVPTITLHHPQHLAVVVATITHHHHPPAAAAAVVVRVITHPQITALDHRHLTQLCLTSHFTITVHHRLTTALSC
jgi:hypothetical protein